MPTPVTDPDLLAQLNAPDRAPVAPTPKVWGDAEAEQAGLYETAAPKRRPVTDPALLAQLNGQQSPGFEGRFSGEQIPSLENEAGLRSGLVNRGAEMTRGPALPPMANAAIDLENQRIAAQQRTTPNIGAQQPNLLSTEVYQNDAGDIQYKDPATGQLVTTDQAKHVTLRDPADGRLKVFARNPETDESSAVGVARVLAPGLAAGAPTARAAVSAAKNIKPAASDILATAKPFYRAFDAEAPNIAVPASSTVQRLRAAVEASKQPEHLAPEVYQTINKLNGGRQAGPSAAERLQAEMNWRPIEPPPERMASLAELRDLKELLGQSSKSPDGRVRAAAGAASREINKIITEASSTAGQNLKTADQIYGTSRSVQQLQRAGDVADLRAGRAGYGGNAVNSMRQVLSPIVQRAIEGKTTGFQPAELAAMREIVEGTGTTNALRAVGQLSPSKGIIQTAAAGGAAAAVGPAALAIPAVGMASNKLATILTGKQIDRLKDLVARRSPEYAAAVKRAAERYERTQANFAAEPSSNKFAAYLSASRSLAAGLGRDGVQITSGDLLRAIQGPMRGAAEDEQP